MVPGRENSMNRVLDTFRNWMEVTGSKMREQVGDGMRLRR